MKRVSRLFFFSTLFWFLPLMNANPLEDFLNTPSLKKGYVGIAIMDCATGQLVCEYNIDKNFIPASLTKLPLTYCALETLGPHFQFKTTLGYEGSLENGILEGDLVIIGGGDPTFNLKDLEVWKEVIEKAGISIFTGAIKVDDTIFEKALASPYWNYEDLGNYYGAGASGLSCHENFYSITFKPGEKIDDPCQVIKIDPLCEALEFTNEVKTGDAGTGDQVYVFGSEYFMNQSYRGTVPIDVSELTVKAAIPDPALFCGQQFAQKLQAKCKVQRNLLEIKFNFNTLHVKHSPPLYEIIKKVNTYSHNLYAEHLLKAIGGGKANDGARKLNIFLKERGIEGDFYDGAGLARINLTSPIDIVKLLMDVKKSANFKYFHDSLAECGNGTLSAFLPLSHCRLKAKTGSIKNIFNLAGYIQHQSGKTFAFCIMCNNINRSNINFKKEVYNFISKFSNDL